MMPEVPQLPPLPATPIHRLRLPEAEARGNTIYVKRDDLLPLALGGNKVRIAYEFIADMEQRGCDALVMYGDAQSNLCRVLANLCHMQRIPSIMVASSHDGGGSPSFNERIVRGFGVEVIPVASTNIAEGVDEAMGRLRRAGRTPYYIYGNRLGTGNEGIAARAYAKAYAEIEQQERELGIPFDLIAVPYGTGCTQGGLICGSLVAEDGRDIVGISISSRPPERAYGVLRETVRDWFAKEGRACPEGFEDRIKLLTRYTRGGYGVSDQQIIDMVQFMLAENALPCDATYTGKALLGLHDYIRDEDISGKSILFLHTGGLPLFFDHLANATRTG